MPHPEDAELYPALAAADDITGLAEHLRDTDPLAPRGYCERHGLFLDASDAFGPLCWRCEGDFDALDAELG